MNILLADDHALFRDSMAIWLKQLDDHIDIKQASSLDEVMRIMKSDFLPQLVLLDLYMPGMQGATSVRHICQFAGHVPLAVMSAESNASVIRQCIRAGAAGFLPKSSGGEVILGALKIIMSGGTYLPTSIIENNSPPPSFSNKQHQILILLAEGLSNKEIARRVNLTEGTVKQYVSAILKKLVVQNRTQAIVKVKEMGLLTK